MLDFILHAILFLSLTGLSFLLVKFIQSKNVFSIVAHTIKDNTKDISIARQKQDQDYFKRVGNTDKLSFFTKMDIALEMSQLKTYFSWINTELVLFMVTVVTFITCTIVLILTKSILYAILAVIVCIFFFYIIVYTLNARITRAVDENLLQLSNLLYSYSNSINDLTTLFDVVAGELDEPLKGAIKQCVNEIKMFEGDTSSAFGRLILKIRHRKLTELLQALEEGSHNSANYRQIISRCYDSISTYKGQKEIRKTMVKGARLNVVIMIVVFLLSLLLIFNITQMTFYEFFFCSFSGKIMFIYCMIIFLYTLWKWITMNK